MFGLMCVISTVFAGFVFWLILVVYIELEARINPEGVAMRKASEAALVKEREEEEKTWNKY
jgi:hypothetical protein